MVRDSERREESRISTDRETIRNWADELGATPVRHEETPERCRVVKESELRKSAERIEWAEFFGLLDEGDQVVVYHGAEASEPFEVVPRAEVVTRSGRDREDLDRRLTEGETVPSEGTETTAVESVIVEKATLESELVDTETVDQRVTDVELQRRECTNCDLVEEGTVEDRSWFDEDRYVGAVGRGGTERTGTEIGTVEATDEFPYYAELDVEETWSVTRESIERFTVESRIGATEVPDTDTVEIRDIDVESLQRSIAESDLLDLDRSSEDVMTECEIESEFDEDDRVHTRFTRAHTVRDKVVDRKRLRADVTGGELVEIEIVDTEEIATEVASDMGTSEPVEERTVEGVTVEGTEPVILSDEEVGKTVVDARGQKIGTVSEVGDSGEVLSIDPHTSITEKVKSALDWGDDKDDYPVTIGQIRYVYDDQVELKGAEELEANERMG